MKRTIILALALAGTAHAEFKDGNKLLSDMRDSSNYVQGVALGYVTGVADVGIGVIHCSPSNLTAGQLHDMIKNYLENTPADRHYSADSIINRVLKTMWPCPKRGGAL